MTTPDKRANALLYSILSPEEARYLRDKGYVPVAAKSGRQYQVSTTEVWEMDSSGQSKVAHYCLVPLDRTVPFIDRLLAKYLLIKGNEEAFRAKAIRHSTNPLEEYINRERRGEFAGLEAMFYEQPPQRRHANRVIRFTQEMNIRHIPDWAAYNYGLPPNVRANPERNTIVYEGVEYRIINQTVENPPAFYGHPARTVTLEVEEVNQPVGRWTDGGRYMTGYAYLPMTEPGNDCDVDRGVGMTATVSLGPAERERIREYIGAARNMTTVSLYGSQWYVTEYNVEQNPENPALYTFSLVRR